MLFMAMVWSYSGGIGRCYLPVVLWMMLCIYIMAPWHIVFIPKQ